ncbi:MAG: AbrB/MazE/SpoVT family DNA-binding domain-containing protein [Armatimonadota bacterium]
MDDGELAAAFYGSAKIGKRGQVIIPANARVDLEIKEGDRLFFVRHPVSKAIVLMKIDALKDFS